MRVELERESLQPGEALNGTVYLNVAQPTEVICKLRMIPSVLTGV